MLLLLNGLLSLRRPVGNASARWRRLRRQKGAGEVRRQQVRSRFGDVGRLGVNVSATTKNKKYNVNKNEACPYLSLEPYTMLNVQCAARVRGSGGGFGEKRCRRGVAATGAVAIRRCQATLCGCIDNYSTQNKRNSDIRKACSGQEAVVLYTPL